MKKSVPKRQRLIKQRHKEKLVSLLKQLHKLGIDVREHAEALGIEEATLKKLEKEEKSFIPPSDSEQLNEFLSNVIGASESLVVMETKIYNQVRPFVLEALKIVFPLRNRVLSFFGIKTIPKILPSEIKKARDLVMVSFKYEKSVFDDYPKLLEKVENAVKGILKLEKKWKGGGQAHLDFLRMHTVLRKMLHEDVSELSREILKLYDLRLDVFRKLIDLDENQEKRYLPKLEVEYFKCAQIKAHYLALYRRHNQKLSKIYGGNR